jgi:hypothetical protein
VEGDVDPHIDSIWPQEVPQGWSGTLGVSGTDFNKSSAVMLDDNFPKTTYLAPGALEASILSTDTSTVGSKLIKIHQLDSGSLSNEVAFNVVAPSKRNAKDDVTESVVRNMLTTVR